MAKRDARLIPFSHEHHSTLRLALKLQREPESEETEALLQELKPMILTHFEEEETLLLPLLRELEEGTAFEARFLQEHKTLRAYFRKGEEMDYPLLGETLKAHTRFEERELFPAIEAYWQKRN